MRKISLIKGFIVQSPQMIRKGSQKGIKKSFEGYWDNKEEFKVPQGYSGRSNPCGVTSPKRECH
jgi:hypothetical protein